MAGLLFGVDTSGATPIVQTASDKFEGSWYENYFNYNATVDDKISTQGAQQEFVPIVVDGKTYGYATDGNGGGRFVEIDATTGKVVTQTTQVVAGYQADGTPIYADKEQATTLQNSSGGVLTIKDGQYGFLDADGNFTITTLSELNAAKDNRLWMQTEEFHGQFLSSYIDVINAMNRVQEYLEQNDQFGGLDKYSAYNLLQDEFTLENLRNLLSQSDMEELSKRIGVDDWKQFKLMVEKKNPDGSIATNADGSPVMVEQNIVDHLIERGVLTDADYTKSKVSKTLNDDIVAHLKGIYGDTIIKDGESVVREDDKEWIVQQLVNAGVLESDARLQVEYIIEGKSQGQQVVTGLSLDSAGDSMFTGLDTYTVNPGAVTEALINQSNYGALAGGDLEAFWSKVYMSATDFADTKISKKEGGRSTSQTSNASNGAPKEAFKKTTVQSKEEREKQEEEAQNSEQTEEVEVGVNNASGGVYDEETLVRVAEYSDSATNPEVIAPQSIIEESLETALAQQSTRKQPSQSSAIVPSSTLITGQGRKQQTSDLTKEVKKLAATGEDLIESGENIIITTGLLSDAINKMALLVSNLINEDGTLNTDFIAVQVDEMVTDIIKQLSTVIWPSVFGEGEESVTSVLKSGVQSVWNGAKSLGGKIVDATSNIWDGFKSGLSKIGGWLGITDTAADGTLDSRGGLSLINEPWAGGTEAIVTPYGTITALPSHTGIVPADLTRNLYQLGEVAPNLIKDTYQSSQENLSNVISNSKMVEDNSISIQKLDAVFQVNENFDFDKFLTEVRGVVSTTRHNK